MSDLVCWGEKSALILKKISGKNGSWPILLSNGGPAWQIERLTTRMAPHLPQQRATQKTEIPDKLYFRIGEVARLCSVAPYVLRFWETEFTQLRPNKSGTGQRLYRRRDVEMALRVKRLCSMTKVTPSPAPARQFRRKREASEAANRNSLCHNSNRLCSGWKRDCTKSARNCERSWGCLRDPLLNHR